MKDEKLNGPQDQMKPLEARTDGGDGAASHVSKPSSPSFRLVTMLADDLERAHVELEFHLVSGRRRRVCLEAPVIDLHVVDVLVAALLERRGDPREFLAGDGAVLTGRRFGGRSGLCDEYDGSEDSDEYWTV
jgi:hypothetical protein